MIQRIQSIFFLLAALFFVGLFFFPLASSSAVVAGIFSDKLLNIHDHILILIVAILGLISSMAGLILFKNRQLQIKLAYLTIVFAILFVVVSILVFINYSKLIPAETEVNDMLGAYLPIGSFLFAFLAAKYIRKDEKLVKSMDRLR